MDLKNTSSAGKNYHRGNMPQLKLFTTNKSEMKFHINKKELLNAVKLTGKAIKNSVVPIVECSRLEIGKKKCKVTGSNFEFFITNEIDCKSSEIVDICIDNKKLIAYLQELPDQELTIEIVDLVAKITDSQGFCKLPVIDGKDYPEIPKIEGEEIEVNSAEFSNAILRTTFAASIDTAMVFSASLIEFGEGIKTVSADGRSIAIKSFSGKVLDQKQLLLKPFILNTIAGMDLGEIVKISYSDTNMVFNYGDTVFYARLSEGKYPNVTPHIPTEHPIVIDFNVPQLTSAIRRVMVFSDKLTEHVTFTIGGGLIVVSGEDKKLNEEGSQSISIEYNGDALKIDFLGKQVLNILNNLQTDNAVAYFKDEKSVMMFKETLDSVDLFINVPSVLL